MLSVLFAQVADKVEKAAEKAGAVATKAAEQVTAAADKAGQVADAAVKAPPTWYEELFKSGALYYMYEGGFFMWPILFSGILALGVIIERYRALQMLSTDNDALRREVLRMLQADRVEEALQQCDNNQGPVAAILGAGLRKFLVLRRLDYDAGEIESQVEKAMDDYGVHITAALEKHLPVLATVSSVAPMLGFLGTVQGMVVSFKEIEAKAGQEDIIKLAAAGIMVALLTTVLGLIVGIPAFTAYNYFTSLINRFVLDVEESATELIEGVTLQIALESKASSEPVTS